MKFLKFSMFVLIVMGLLFGNVALAALEDYSYDDVGIEVESIGTHSVYFEVDDVDVDFDAGHYYDVYCSPESHDYYIYLNRDGYLKEEPSSNGRIYIEVEGMLPGREYSCMGGVITDDGGVAWGDEVVVTTHEVESSADDIFSDVAKLHKNNTAISYLYDAGIIRGYFDATFRPDNEINRAEFLKILVQTQAGDISSFEYDSCFPDVPVDSWYHPYVCFAKGRQDISGYPDGTFRPDQPINKVEALKMMFEVFEVWVYESSAGDQYFDDVDEDAWYAKYVGEAYQWNIIEEATGDFEPGNNRTRAEVAENMYRFLNSFKQYGFKFE